MNYERSIERFAEYSTIFTILQVSKLLKFRSIFKKLSYFCRCQKPQMVGKAPRKETPELLPGDLLWRLRREPSSVARKCRMFKRVEKVTAGRK